jgi:hypothetical protein
LAIGGTGTNKSGASGLMWWTKVVGQEGIEAKSGASVVGVFTLCII